MSNISQPERATQNRVLKLFTSQLGYRPLGDWKYRKDNSDIEEQLLTEWLTESGYSPAHIRAALQKLRIAAPRRMDLDTLRMFVLSKQSK